MKYKLTDLKIFNENIEDILGNSEETAVSLITNNKTILSPRAVLADEELESNYSILKTHYNGGVIVVCDGDITLVNIAHRNNKPNWLNDLNNFLLSKGINSSKDKNDIIIDGQYKVAGYSDKFINTNIHYYGIQISLNVDLDLIQKASKKPMVKIPKGLSDYNITREDILAALDIEEI